MISNWSVITQLLCCTNLPLSAPGEGIRLALLLLGLLLL